MAVTLRLARFGKKGQPFYRIVAVEKTRKRNGAYIEAIGSYNPMSKPHKVEIQEDRLNYWLKVGATISEGLQKLNIIKKA
ncbi:MAG: 30S ribosomal protein S16 [Patescibacteria group bacterium]